MKSLEDILTINIKFNNNVCNYLVSAEISKGNVIASIFPEGFTTPTFAIKGTYKDNTLALSSDHLGHHNKEYEINGKVTSKEVNVTIIDPQTASKYSITGTINNSELALTTVSDGIDLPDFTVTGIYENNKLTLNLNTPIVSQQYQGKGRIGPKQVPNKGSALTNAWEESYARDVVPPNPK